MKNYNPKYISSKKLWDSHWLKKIYPERFDNYYYKEDLRQFQSISQFTGAVKPKSTDHPLNNCDY